MPTSHTATESDDRFLTAAQVKARYGAVSDMWLYRRHYDDSDFPKPMIIEKRRFWRLSDLTAWERKRAAGPPQQAVRKRRMTSRR
jgi:predicted DNA-binding transcriptional regulator AlpA